MGNQRAAGWNLMTPPDTHFISFAQMERGEKKSITMVSSYAVTYHPSLNVYRDITPKNKAWKEVAPMAASSSERIALEVHIRTGILCDSTKQRRTG